MQNTHAHASLDATGQHNWWLSVNYDENNNVECFSFFDYGVGVFTSLENKQQGTKFHGGLAKLRNLIVNPDNARILSSIMEGNLHRTSTGKYYRGKGLPGIKTAIERNQISNAVIVTNDVYGEINENKYINLQNSLDGTFIYWELNGNTKLTVIQTDNMHTFVN